MDRQISDQRETKLSLPGWCVSRINWLAVVTIGGRTKKYLPTAIPILTADERSNIEDQIQKIERHITPQANDDQEKLELIGDLLVKTAGGAMSEREAQLKINDYLVALRDSPVWAVRQALDAWRDGTVPGVPLNDFKWAPSTAILRHQSLSYVQPYRDMIKDAQILLDAKHIDETMTELESGAHSPIKSMP